MPKKTLGGCDIHVYHATDNSGIPVCTRWITWMVQFWMDWRVSRVATGASEDLNMLLNKFFPRYRTVDVECCPCRSSRYNWYNRFNKGICERIRIFVEETVAVVKAARGVTREFARKPRAAHILCSPMFLFLHFIVICIFCQTLILC